MITYPDNPFGAAGSQGMSPSTQRTSSRKSKPMSEKDYRSFIKKMLDKARRISHRHGNRNPFAWER